MKNAGARGEMTKHLGVLKPRVLPYHPMHDMELEAQTPVRTDTPALRLVKLHSVKRSDVLEKKKPLLRTSVLTQEARFTSPPTPLRRAQKTHIKVHGAASWPLTAVVCAVCVSASLCHPNCAWGFSNGIVPMKYCFVLWTKTHQAVLEAAKHQDAVMGNR